MYTKKKKRRNEEPIESVIWGAVDFALFMTQPEEVNLIDDIYEWCNPKLMYMGTVALKAMYRNLEIRLNAIDHQIQKAADEGQDFEDAPLQEAREMWAKMRRHIEVILENRGETTEL